MGFDKPGESKFIIPVSDTQAYKQFGNAVVPPLIEAIARHMLPWIIGKKKGRVQATLWCPEPESNRHGVAPGRF